jgi:signal transduction histidine kinase
VVDDNPSIHSDFRKILACRSALDEQLDAAANALFGRRDTAPGSAQNDPVFRIDCAGSGEAAIEMVAKAIDERDPYALAFVDIQMPNGLDGVETVSALWSGQPDLQIVICTAFSDYTWSEIQRRLGHSNRFLILKKPFDALEVRQIADSLTDRARAEKELEQTHRRLVESAHLAGKAEIATTVLHNVGNILNSLATSVAMLRRLSDESRHPRLAQVARLLSEHREDWSTFLTEDECGRNLPQYLGALCEHFESEQETLRTEIGALQKHIAHIQAVIDMQQQHAGGKEVVETFSLADAFEEALALASGHILATKAKIVRDFPVAPMVTMLWHGTLAILVNFLKNACEALQATPVEQRQITARIARTSRRTIVAEVIDTGAGIAADVLPKLFMFGFTTRPGGHGFGLHSAALKAKEMGAQLFCTSEGAGRGATFTLEFPAQTRTGDPY